MGEGPEKGDATGGSDDLGLKLANVTKVWHKISPLEKNTHTSTQKHNPWEKAKTTKKMFCSRCVHWIKTAAEEPDYTTSKQKKLWMTFALNIVDNSGFHSLMIIWLNDFQCTP